MWWFLVLVLCYQGLSQPVTDELTRQPRELIECCPCPSHGSEDTLGRSSQLGRESVDDCPCRARSADSEGASSILFPSSVRPDGPHIRPFNSKEEAKNLLKPEVGLATSMLQTLREATEEEYRDALARDAARSAAGLDGNGEESKNLLIIVNPRSSEDDALEEASHVQESRCVHPLGSASIARMRPLAAEPDLLPDILKLPRLRRPGLPHRNLLDMDSSVGASNVEEKVVGINGDTLIGKSKPTSILRSNTPLKSKLFANANKENLDEDAAVSKSPASLLRSSIPFKSKLFANTNDESDSNPLFSLKSPLLSKPKFKPLFDGLKLPLVPKMKAASPLENGIDLNHAPSTLQEVLGDPKEKLSSLLAKHPPILRNLWKLKDVELLPPARLANKPIFKLPKASVPLLRNTNTADDFDDTASGETKDMIRSEVKPTNELENMKSADSVTDIKGETNELENMKSADSVTDINDDNCTNNINVPSNQNQDLSESPSNVIQTALTTTEIPNTSEERDVPNTDSELSPSENLTKSTEIENTDSDSNCQVTSELKSSANSVQNDNNLESGSIQNDNTENFETSLNDADVAIDEEPIDSFTDTSNINSVVVEPESKVQDPVDQIDDNDTFLSPPKDSVDELDLPQSINPTSSTILPEPIFKPIPSLSDTLSAIRDNIKKLDFFINPTKTLTSKEIDDDITKFENEKKEKDSTDNFDFVPDNSDMSDVTGNHEKQPKSLESTDQDASNSVTLEDLQTLSDDLLDTSSNQDQKTITPTGTNDEQPESRKKFEDEQNREIDSENVTNAPLPIFTQDQNKQSEENVKENACPNNDLPSVQKNVESTQVKSVDQDREPSEMKTSASEPIISTLPNILDPLNLSDKLKLPFQNKIVQPSLPILPDPLNLLDNPLDDIIDLNPKLPTLDDIREQISNVFNTNINERSANESQEEYDYDEEEIEKMAPGASTTNSQIKLPTIKLKDNSDLFQLGSAKSSQRNSLSNNQNINLNSYRAKVPVPKSLDLKPIKLETNSRNKDGMLRTPLQLKTDRRPIARTKLSNSKLPSKSILLRDPAMNLPTLDQLKDALHTSPNRLLANPLQPNLNLFRSTPISDLSDDIRLNAEKTMKSLQKKMRTSLRTPQTSEPLARPQEFLEDVNDKLKAIHYDLNDRLASVHDNILDTSKLQLPTNLLSTPLQLPTNLLRTPDNLFNKNLRTSSRASKPKPLRMQTLASSLSSHDVKSQEKPIARKIDTSQVKASSRLSKNQDFAASAPIPVRLERPKLGKELDRLPLQKFNERTVPSIDAKLKSIMPKPVFRKPNFKDSRVAITFGSTTPSSLRSADIPVTRLPPRLDDDTVFPKFKANPIGSRFTPSSKSPLNPRALLPKSVQTPVKFTSKLKDLDNQRRQSPSLKFVKKNPVFSSPISRSKVTDVDKLKLLGDAVKERLSNFDSFKHSKVPKLESSHKPQGKLDNTQTKLTSNSDMLRSASENTDVVISQEPLKENVSYKCRLVCTKENM